MNPQFETFIYVSDYSAKVTISCLVGQQQRLVDRMQPNSTLHEGPAKRALAEEKALEKKLTLSNSIIFALLWRDGTVQLLHTSSVPTDARRREQSCWQLECIHKLNLSSLFQLYLFSLSKMLEIPNTSQLFWKFIRADSDPNLSTVWQ